MSTNTKYNLPNNEETGLSEEEISNILRNPTEPDKSGILHRRKRILSTAAALVILLALVIIGFYASLRSPSREASSSVNIANDSRLDSYRSVENARECPDWPLTDDGPQRSSIAFEFPSTFELLFALSNGKAVGSISIIRSEITYPPSAIQVNVTARYHDRASLERAKVCRTGQESKNEHGVLVWAPPTSSDTLNFEITILIPRNFQEGYNDLSTDLPYFSHHIGNFFELWSPTTFRDIRLKSWNAPIDYGSLIGEAAYIQTNNAKVQGFFAGPKSVNVFTTNSAIHSTSMMFGAADGWESKVHLRTSNAPVTAFISVTSDYAEPKLTASIHTTNGALNVTTTNQMSNPSFFLEASTSNALSYIDVYREYEGSYDLETSATELALVEVDMRVTDPSRKGRQRTVKRMSTGSHARGVIFWSQDGQPPPPEEGLPRAGAIKVQNSGAPITLNC